MREVLGEWAPATPGNYSVTNGAQIPVARVLRLHCKACDWTSQPGTIDSAGFVQQDAATSPSGM